MTKKLYCVGYGYGYANWFEDVELTGDFEDPKFQIEDADIVLFTGGEDINPAIYGKEPHPTSYWPGGCSEIMGRDLREIKAFKRVRPDALAYGTCRGMQLLAALNGAILCQDVSNHWCAGTHEIHNDNGDKYRITSLHHQMVYPFDLNPEWYDILFKTTPRSEHYYGDGIDKTMYELHGEPEVILFHKPGLPKCLGVQGHPEMMSNNAPVVKMLNKLIDSILNK